MAMTEYPPDSAGPDLASIPPALPERDDTPPWELIDKGRYMPRRIRGSCRGRELG